jgi:hypothetical protein
MVSTFSLRRLSQIYQKKFGMKIYHLATLDEQQRCESTFRGVNFRQSSTFNFLLSWLVLLRRTYELRDARFFLVKLTKTEKKYQMTTNYTKGPYNISSGHKIFEIAIYHLYQHFPFQSPPKYT